MNSGTRHARQLIGALLLTLILTTVMLLSFWFLRQRLQERVLASLIELQQQTSLSLEYDHITIDLFDRILLDRVRISGIGEEEPLIEIGSLGANFSLFELLQGPQKVKTIEISISSLSIKTDQAQLESLLETVTYLLTAFPAREDLNIIFSLTQIDLSTIIEDRPLEVNIPQLEGRFFKGNVISDATIPLELSFDQIRLSTDLAVSYSIPLGRGTLDIGYMDFFYQGVSKELSLSAKLDSGVLIADLVTDSLEASITYETGASGLSLKGRTKEFSLGKEDLVIGVLPDSLSVPDGVYTAEITSLFAITADIEKGLQSYQLDAQIENIILEGDNEPLSVSVSASGDESEVTINSLETVLGSLAINAEGTIRYADPLWPKARISVSDSQEVPVALLEILDDTPEPTIEVSSGLIPGKLQARYTLSDTILRLDGIYDWEGAAYEFVALLDVVNRAASFDVADSLLADLVVKKEGGLTLSASLDHFSLPQNDHLLLSGDLEGTFIDFQDWSAAGRSITLEGLKVADGTLLAGGDFDATGTSMELENLNVFDGQTTYEGSGTIRYPQGISGILSDSQAELNLQTGESELYRIIGSVNQRSYSVDLSIESGRLEHIPLSIGSGDLSAELSFIGDLYDYTLEGNLVLSDGVIGSTEVDLSLSLSLAEDRLSLFLPQGVFGSFDYSDLSVEYEQDSGLISVSSNLTFELDKRKISSIVSASAMILPQRIDPQFRLQSILQEGVDATVTLGSILINSQEISPVVIDASIKDELVRITSADLSDLSVDYRLDTGSFKAVLNEGLPIRFTMDGRIQDGMIEAYTEDLQANATVFTELGLPFFTFADGILEGRVTILGPFSDLEYYGELFGSSIEASIPFVPNGLFIDDLYVSLIGKEFVFAPFSIRYGASSATASLSLFVDDVMPTGLDLKVDIPKDQPVPFENGFGDIRLYYAGTLAGSLHLYGGFTDFTLEANALADNGFFTQFVSDEKNPRSFSNIRLKLETGKNLQMIFPNKDLPIITATAKEGETISVTADLVKNQYNAVGDITLRGGEIVYFKRNFYIVNGSLDINISQALIDPKVSVVAKLKDFDSNGDKIDIFLTVEDDSVFKLSPVFSSSPSKSLAEISEILGKNIIPSNTDRNSDFSTALAVATLATDVIQQVGLIEIDPIGDLELSIRNALKLDLFSIRTQVLQNILLDTLPGDFGTTFTRNPIARYLDNTTVFLGKYITNDMFLQAIIQLSAREGLGGGLFITDDIGLDIEVSYEWDNPLYDLSVSMQPESLAVTDILDSIKLGVSWNITF